MLSRPASMMNLPSDASNPLPMGGIQRNASLVSSSTAGGGRVPNARQSLYQRALEK